MSLLDAKAYRLFRGVLASFRLSRPRPGLTIVTRDRGTLGNLLARAGGQIERLTLEDPRFESLFEAYGDSQVGSRVILTTTMLERLAALDRQAHAHGFACAFLEDHLLVALPGMSWRCPWWRIVMPVGDWLEDYAAWLAGLVDLPVDIVHTLNIAAPSPATGTSLSPDLGQSFPIGTNSGHVFSAPFWRLVGEGGTALIYVASGSLFGGLALFGAWYGLHEGYSNQLFWYFWGLIATGILYGIFAVTLGLREIARLAWRWNAPLRTIKRP
jgi:hypothetical protein